MTSEVVNLRERIEKVRAEMAGESNTVEEVISKDNNYKSELKVKDDFKVTEELKIENPKFKLCSDDLKVIVSVEIPDNVAVSLNADLKDNGEIL